ncbi:hypothetical protein TIFTF001_055510 [Ficus carica]|uniref:Uncharacterized protein n=1 Tax=Ficus carica TaxID=3494 RepID=A0AA88EAD9_FICCA|nr:hypothetical protein TIFTF001_055508 [Ficus carica]GMN71098.1 hypothetical protein TIFTF001_055510 [Ficus carica]
MEEMTAEQEAILENREDPNSLLAWDEYNSTTFTLHELDSHVVSKNFMPFSGGTRQRAGAEYSRVFMATFFHVLLTRYRRMKIKAGKIY